MNRLILMPRATADIEDIADFIALDAPRAASRMVERISQVALLLRDNPHIGTPREDIAEGVKLFPIGKDLILFHVLEDGVKIVRVLHGARKIDDLI